MNLCSIFREVQMMLWGSRRGLWDIVHGYLSLTVHLHIPKTNLWLISLKSWNPCLLLYNTYHYLYNYTNRLSNYLKKTSFEILYFLNLVYFLSLVGLWQNHVIYLPLTGLMSRYMTPFTKRVVTKYGSVCYCYRSFFYGTCTCEQE